MANQQLIGAKAEDDCDEELTTCFVSGLGTLAHTVVIQYQNMGVCCRLAKADAPTEGHPQPQAECALSSHTKVFEAHHVHRDAVLENDRGYSRRLSPNDFGEARDQDSARRCDGNLQDDEVRSATFQDSFCHRRDVSVPSSDGDDGEGTGRKESRDTH